MIFITAIKIVAACHVMFVIERASQLNNFKNNY